ncbi:MAG TPA: HEAT repeat domain-containing protein [Candidatus Eisenbacteria bacterium]|nr:HEAT repeat domain-containing protein [Candidatus Eisenbacteria bacterium]
MSDTARAEETGVAERTPEQDARARAAGAWVGQLARTLKTCRLYDAGNPTVAKFRDELFAALTRLLAEHGTLVLRFQSDDVRCEEVSLYAAKSRDDNLALPFYRDGIHALTLSPGIEARELDAVLDAVLLVTGQTGGEDDLVTLLWEAQLAHVDVDYVPIEGDVGAGGQPVDESTLVPWPTPTAESESETPPAQGAGGGRSDDWNTGDLAVEVAAAFEELDALGPSEVARLRQELEAEHAVPVVTAAVAVAHAYLASGAGPPERTELGRFLPRVLRLAIHENRWDEAGVCMRLLEQCPGWSVESFAQELLQPISVTGVVQQLDQHGPDAVPALVGFAHQVGPPGLDWLNLLLAESQQRRVRRELVEAITRMCRHEPERLAPWLADPRWYMVRNVVHILGCIGGDAVVGLLQTAARHPEPRVRYEVVAALGQVSPQQARPLLIAMLDDASDPRLFRAVLHQLSLARDEAVARRMMVLMRDPAFETRPIEERRAIWSTLGATATDDELPELEQELYRGNWFSRLAEVQRQAIARCVARIGTPLARAVLQRGAQSRRTPVKRACEEALAALGEDARG